MSTLQTPSGRKRPLIGCITYRKTSGANPPVELHGLASAYIEAVIAAGGIPFLIPLGLSEADLQVVLGQIDGLLLPGGGDINPGLYNGRYNVTIRNVDENRDQIEFYMVRQAVARQKPLLAICRGHQVFNVALGGTLWEDVKSQKPGAIRHNYCGAYARNHLAHTVDLLPGSKVARLLGQATISVNSIHHQGIRDMAPELVVTAQASDGLIEGVESPGHPFAVGVQWHPECLVRDDPAMLSLFKGLVKAASNGRK